MEVTMYQNKHGNYFLYKRDHAIIALVRRKMATKEGRPATKTAVIRAALDVISELWGITEEEILTELTPKKEEDDI
jgi:hypothetical protein